jgi:hypothetical protein
MLKLPAKLVCSVVGAVGLAAVACGGDDDPVADAAVADAPAETYFCIDDGTLPDAGPGQDAGAMCGVVVTDPADCPPGCVPVG